MPVQTQMQVRRGTASSWTSTNPTLAAGELGFETDTGKFKIGTGSSTWNSLLYAGGGQSSLTTYQYTATAAQTTFSGTDANGNTLAYTVGAVQVYLNGALLQNTADYTASNGTSIVLAAGALAGDSLTIISFATFDVANTIPVSAFTAKGQILVATGSGAYTAQAVGTNGQLLSANSAQADGVEWVNAPSSGGITLLSTTSASGATVTVSSIDQTYRDLVVVVQGLTNATAPTGLICNFNISNYTVGATHENGTTNVATKDGNWALTTLLRTSPNNVFVFEVTNYASTTRYKGVKMFGFGSTSTGSFYANLLGGLNSNTAVSSFTISNDNAHSFNGGEILVYGVK
jgi:hypothetical protein